MSALDHRFEIVTGVDLSEYSDTVLEHAYDEAVRHDNPSIHLLTVVPDKNGLFHHPSEADLSRAEELAKNGLGETAKRVLDDAVPENARRNWRIRLHVRRGRPEEQLVMLADETAANLIVVGRFGLSGRRKRDIGSVADRVIAQAECPVLVVNFGREASATAMQCPACVEVRANTDGEQWFCERHHGGYLGHTIALHSMPSIRGGTMW